MALLALILHFDNLEKNFLGSSQLEKEYSKEDNSGHYFIKTSGS